MDVREILIGGPVRPTRILLPAALAVALLAACNRGEEPETPETAQAPEVSAEATEPGSGAAADEPAAQPTEAAAPTPPAQPLEVARDTERRPDVEANRELAAALGLAPPDPLLVSDLLTRADVRELAQFRGELLETGLAGIEPSPNYNTIRLQADGGYGFALQLWQHDEIRQLSTHFRRLRETYFDSSTDGAGVANEAFTADFQGIRHYGFMHRASKSIAVVTCDDALCDATQLRSIAQRVANRL